MVHDSFCELHRACPDADCQLTGLHCHCGGRGFALCPACKTDNHRKHTRVDIVSGHVCQCDLE